MKKAKTEPANTQDKDAELNTEREPSKVDDKEHLQRLAQLPEYIREKVAESFSLSDNVRLKRASGPKMRMELEDKVKLLKCIDQGDKKKWIPAILEGYPRFKAAATTAYTAKCLPQVLQHVARGEQNEAEKVFADHPERIEALLTTPGTFTDLSGRTFNCTAFEYAYWSGDWHMCQMLKKQIDDDPNIQKTMLELINTIDKNGLTYWQHDKEVTGSTQLDLKPLIQALTTEGWRQVKQQQSDAPVWLVNYYCRMDRLFEVSDSLGEEVTLPRVITIYNPDIKGDESWYYCVAPESPYTFMMCAGVLLSEQLLRVTREGALLDAAVISRLVEVRDSKLAQLRNDLETRSSLNMSH